MTKDELEALSREAAKASGELFGVPQFNLFTETDRALSLTQPWATLVEIGAKKYETRCWRTNYRGWLAIHAAKGFPKDCRDLCLEEPFFETLRNADYLKAGRALPLGRVLCVALLTDCISTNEFHPGTTRELNFGDYSPNRWAWKFDRVHRIKPFDAKGALSIWKMLRPVTTDDILGASHDR